MFESKWLKEQLRQAENLPEEFRKIDDDNVVRDGETVVGEVPLGLRPLLGRVMQLRSEANRIANEHAKSHFSGDDSDPETCKKVREDAQWMLDQAAALARIITMSIRHELNQSNGNIDVRAGFQVVTIKPRLRGFSIADLLSEALGGSPIPA